MSVRPEGAAEYPGKGISPLSGRSCVHCGRPDSLPTCGPCAQKLTHQGRNPYKSSVVYVRFGGKP